MQNTISRFDLPAWELAGAAVLAEPAAGGLDYLTAVEHWCRAPLLSEWRDAQTAKAAAEAQRSAAVQARSEAISTIPGPFYSDDDIDPEVLARWQKSVAELGTASTACAVAERAAHDDFKLRWCAGEFVAFGTDPRTLSRVLITTSWSGEINFAAECPNARIIGSFAFQQVRFYWLAQADACSAPMRTGMPGRPTKGRDLILAEFERRKSNKSNNETEPTIGAQAEALKQWFVKAHPNADCPQVGSITNLIRVSFNGTKTPQK